MKKLKPLRDGKKDFTDKLFFRYRFPKRLKILYFFFVYILSILGYFLWFKVCLFICLFVNLAAINDVCRFRGSWAERYCPDKTVFTWTNNTSNNIYHSWAPLRGHSAQCNGLLFEIEEKNLSVCFLKIISTTQNAFRKRDLKIFFQFFDHIYIEYVFENITILKWHCLFQEGPMGKLWLLSLFNFSSD